MHGQAYPAPALSLTGLSYAPLEILDLVETILVYKFPRLTREAIRDMLQLPVADLQQTRFYQAVYGEGRQEGRQKWRAAPTGFPS
jgi:predicted transposase YdaD